MTLIINRQTVNTVFPQSVSCLRELVRPKEKAIGAFNLYLVGKKPGDMCFQLVSEEGAGHLVGLSPQPAGSDAVSRYT